MLHPFDITKYVNSVFLYITCNQCKYHTSNVLLCKVIKLSLSLSEGMQLSVTEYREVSASHISIFLYDDSSNNIDFSQIMIVLHFIFIKKIFKFTTKKYRLDHHRQPGIHRCNTGLEIHYLHINKLSVIMLCHQLYSYTSF